MGEFWSGGWFLLGMCENFYGFVFGVYGLVWVVFKFSWRGWSRGIWKYIFFRFRS